LGGELAVTDRFAEGDLAESFPDALLERGAANIERKVETGGGRFDKGNDARDGFCEAPIARNKAGVWKLFFKRLSQRFRIVAELMRADADV
jgi:hypothetical protein